MYENFGFTVYQERLREAEKRRKQYELIRAAEAYARRENDGQRENFVQRVLRMLNIRNQPKQVANDAQRAAAH